MNPAIRPYQIVIATEIRDLAVQVNDMVAAGWEPQGGPFHVGIYNPPHGGMGQAIFRRDTTNPNCLMDAPAKKGGTTSAQPDSNPVTRVVVTEDFYLSGKSSRRAKK